MQQYNAISSSPSTDPAYDYSVILRNLKPLGVDMANPVDRQKLAVAYLGDKCPNGKIVSETALKTTMPGLGPSDMDYAVRLKC
ncbi:hypothetical protein [Aureimonas leprariae]|uniref:Uncharacterized protein n=1 Tax=Plantimonas leprariae TaxID=2615207 RepID=A0A7V7PKV4_9HYPH|nr:hypothetical protein [Aureimonas leprariae]KAB0676569.1 hypothetical protein F6X38_21020 [Aureimonas leprariae]